jgi:type II secretory pathway component PulJ
MNVRDMLRDTRGFSLLSVIVAMALMSFLFVALTKGVITVQETHRYSYFTTVANSLAQARLEELANRPYSQIASGSDNNPIDEIGRPVQSGQYARFWVVQDDTPGRDLKTVTVRVEWDTPAWQTGTPAAQLHVIEIASIVSKEAKDWL